METISFIGLFCLLFISPWVYSIIKVVKKPEKGGYFLKLFSISALISSCIYLYLKANSTGGEFHDLEAFYTVALSLVVFFIAGLVTLYKINNKIVPAEKSSELLDD